MSFVADDGRFLDGTWYLPLYGTERGIAVLAPAMATPARFYASIARWLARNGVVAFTFDLRGMGSGDVRREDADLVRWGHDAASALRFVDAARGEMRLGPLPITWIGHSFGGQVLPFIRHDLLTRAILVATGHGYYRNNPTSLRRKAPFLWRFIVPISTRLYGYFPGRRLGVLDDLPARVARQWGRWCLHPEYWGADIPDVRERHAAVGHPVTTISFTDDEIVTFDGLQALVAQLTGARVESLLLTPDQVGADAVGHHGFFSSRCEAGWRRWLLPRIAVLPDPRAAVGVAV